MSDLQGTFKERVVRLNYEGQSWTFSQAGLQEWLAQKGTDPITGEPMEKDKLDIVNGPGETKRLSSDYLIFGTLMWLTEQDDFDQQFVSLIPSEIIEVFNNMQSE